MPKDRERKDTGTDESKKSNLRISSDNQYEMTEAETPLYLACEDMVKAKAKVSGAKEALEKAETLCITEMKKAKKKQVNHKGDLLQLVDGKTIEDHIRFAKP